MSKSRIIKELHDGKSCIWLDGEGRRFKRRIGEEEDRIEEKRKPHHRRQWRRKLQGRASVMANASRRIKQNDVWGNVSTGGDQKNHLKKQFQSVFKAETVWESKAAEGEVTLKYKTWVEERVISIDFNRSNTVHKMQRVIWMISLATGKTSCIYVLKDTAYRKGENILYVVFIYWVHWGLMLF